MLEETADVGGGKELLEEGGVAWQEAAKCSKKAPPPCGVADFNDGHAAPPKRWQRCGELAVKEGQKNRNDDFWGRGEVCRRDEVKGTEWRA